MFERFTERARKVVVLAQQEARTFNHNYIGTEHLLLGLIRVEDGVAARVLGHLGVRLNAAREQVEGIVGYGEEATGGQAPFTPRSKKALEIALRESMQLDQTYIGTEHILLGLIRGRDVVSFQMLSGLGVSPADVRREVLRALKDSDWERARPAAPMESAPAAVYSREPTESPDAVFQVRVKGLEVRAAVGTAEEERSRPRRLMVDLEYSYDEFRSLAGTETLNPEAVMGGVAGALGESLVSSLPEAVERVGRHVLETFPEIAEAIVTITDDYENGDVAVSGMSVTKVFRRALRR